MDWIDRVEVVETDRKYLLVVKKEILGLNLPDKNGNIDKGILWTRCIYGISIYTSAKVFKSSYL